MMKLRQKKQKDQQQTILGRSADQERTRSKKTGRIHGYIEIFCGVILLLAGIWLFSQTWGLKLLTVDVWIGRISRFYGIFLLTACICFAVGFWTITHRVRLTEKEDELETGKDTSVKMKGQANCPVCGKLNASVNKFCMFCGSRMEATM